MAVFVRPTLFSLLRRLVSRLRDASARGRAMQGARLLARARAENARQFGTLVSDDAGVRLVKSGRVAWAFRWSDVRRISAEKMDLHTYDEVYVGVLFDNGVEVALHESMGDFDAFVAAMMQHFPDVPTDWFSRVAHPAFAQNLTLLWERR